MRKQDRLGAAQIVGWTAVGLGLGLFAGLAAGQYLGLVSRTRVRNAWRSWREPAAEALLPAATAARTVHQALADHPELAPLDLGVLGVSTGTVELRGWVPSRRLRSQATRYARDVPGIESVINRILVRGEDDLSYDDLQVTDQPA